MMQYPQTILGGYLMEEVIIPKLKEYQNSMVEILWVAKDNLLQKAPVEIEVDIMLQTMILFFLYLMEKMEVYKVERIRMLVRQIQGKAYMANN